MAIQGKRGLEAGLHCDWHPLQGKYKVVRRTMLRREGRQVEQATWTPEPGRETFLLLKPPLVPCYCSPDKMLRLSNVLPSGLVCLVI